VFDRGRDERIQLLPIAIHIDNHDRFVMPVQLLPGDHFQRFVQRSHAAGQHHEGVGQVEHALLAAMHTVDHLKIGDIRMAMFSLLEKFRYDADDVAALRQHTVRQRPHQARLAAAEYQNHAGFGDMSAKALSVLTVPRVTAAGRAAKDANRSYLGQVWFISRRHGVDDYMPINCQFILDETFER
jgi:hypothetical protein